jgi:hypothetical protein
MAQAAVIRLVAGVCGIVLALATACSGINARTDSFNTLADARQAGAIEQGRLPEGVPPGTRDIRIGYVPGSTERWGLFNFPQEEAPALRALLQPREVSLTGKRIDVPGRVEWWPVALRGELDGERLGLTGLKTYVTTDDALFVAVNWNQGRAYYWNAR